MRLIRLFDMILVNVCYLIIFISTTQIPKQLEAESHRRSQVRWRPLHVPNILISTQGSCHISQCQRFKAS